MPPEVKTELQLTEEQVRMKSLEIIKDILKANCTGRVDKWQGDSGPMYNLHLRNNGADESPVAEYKTVAELATATVANLKGSGYWIQFEVQEPDGRGQRVAQEVTLWSFAKQGYLVCKGREAFQSTINASVTKSQKKEPKINVDGTEVKAGEKISLNLGVFGGTKDKITVG